MSFHFGHSEAYFWLHLDLQVVRWFLYCQLWCSKDSAGAISPLSLACLSGQASLVQLLLCASAAMDGPEGHGGAPLLHAAYKNFAKICEILLDAGASPHVAFTQSGHIQLQNPPSKTPLDEDQGLHNIKDRLCHSGGPVSL